MYDYCGDDDDAAEDGPFLRAFADEVVCLQTPEFFYAVGQFYRSFPQVDDNEVIALLRPAANEPAPSVGAAAQRSR